MNEIFTCVAWQEPIAAPPHDQTGMSPNLIMLGQEVRMSAEVVVKPHVEEVVNYGKYMTGLRERKRQAHNCGLSSAKSRPMMQKAVSIILYPEVWRGI